MKLQNGQIAINVIASGSSGNCTAVQFGEDTILLDAGIKFDRIMSAINFELPRAIFITHEHCDHANKSAIAEFLKRGVEVYMTGGTAQKLKLDSHNLKIVEQLTEYELESFTFYPFPAVHDAADPVCFSFGYYYKMLDYVIDTGYLQPYDAVPDYLLIEANHSAQTLLDTELDEPQKKRIAQNHLSLEKVVKYLLDNPKDFLTEVHLLHVSKRHGDPEYFKKVIQSIVGAEVIVKAGADKNETV